MRDSKKLLLTMLLCIDIGILHDNEKLSDLAKLFDKKTNINNMT